jgi:hypothetical protein
MLHKAVSTRVDTVSIHFAVSSFALGETLSSTSVAESVTIIGRRERSSGLMLHRLPAVGSCVVPAAACRELNVTHARTR